MAEEHSDAEEDQAADDDSGQNQYGGDSGEADAVEQTERVEEDDAGEP